MMNITRPINQMLMLGAVLLGILSLSLFQAQTALADTSMTATSTISGTTVASSTTGTTTSGGQTIQIMTHLCGASIKNEEDFEKMEKGKSAVAALAADVLACPTTGLAGDNAATGTVAAPRTSYNFTVMSGTQSRSLSDGTFMQHKVCESDLGMDVNSDGSVASRTCLDISHYEVPVSSADTQIHVAETSPPSGYHFGTLRFTPVAIDANNDSESFKFLDPATGHIHLNSVTDKDGAIMLHVYQFRNAGSGNGQGNGGMGTSTDDGNHGSGNDGQNGNGNNGSIQTQIRAIQHQIDLIRQSILEFTH